MSNHADLLSGKCPVCRTEAIAVEHARATVKRKSGAVGAPQAPQVVEVPVTVLTEGFGCGLRRQRTFEDTRWSSWTLHPDHECSKAQEVALQLRQELNDARARETPDAG